MQLSSTDFKISSNGTKCMISSHLPRNYIVLVFLFFLMRYCAYLTILVFFFDHSCYYSINALYFTFFFWGTSHILLYIGSFFFLFFFFLFLVYVLNCFFFFNKVMLTSANNFKISKNNILDSIFWVTINLIFVFL